MRDLKLYTAEVLYKSIQNNYNESRRDGYYEGWKEQQRKNKKAAKSQLWQPESHPVQLINSKMAHQQLDYIPYNPVEACFVTKAEEWKYSIVIDYYGGKGRLEIIKLDNLIV